MATVSLRWLRLTVANSCIAAFISSAVQIAHQIVSFEAPRLVPSAS